MYAQVVFPIASFKSFTYKIPRDIEQYISAGIAVNAPFKNTLQIGYIISTSKVSTYKGKTNNIDSIYKGQPSIPQDLWKTILWMSDYYLAPIGICIKAALSNVYYKDDNIRKSLLIEINIKTLSLIDKNKLSKNQKTLINDLSNMNIPTLASTFSKKISNLYYTIDALYKKNILNKIYIDIEKHNIDESNRVDIILSPKQQKIFDQINISIEKSKFKGFLIHGIPGSGKTEIYVKLAQQTIAKGKNVIVLIPEIILTTQMKDRFIKYFGTTIAMWHSKMTIKEKKITIKKILKGEHNIIIGARSSVFSPLPNVGLIIIDEEQDSSYKQESPKPYYNARDIGLLRAKHANCPVVLTSATPSVETYHNTLIGKINYLTLDEKFYKSQKPIIKIVNMLELVTPEHKQTIISDELLNHIDITLKKNKQIILLNNRRGYASSVLFKANNELILCDHCNVPMSFHKTRESLLCHYCDSNKLLTDKIDNASGAVVLNGYGTEKIHEILSSHFSDASISRVDSDSLRKKSLLSSVLSDFESGSIDILIGTQMISKGLDFDNVELVGVINADYGMFIPDFRSGEKVFQIISQVIGRSGRRERQGTAIIQTYNPDDINLLNAIQSKSKTFYSLNLAERNELQYPPFSRLCRLIFNGSNLDEVRNVAENITNIFSQNKKFKVLGPSDAPISKIKNKWRINSLISASKDNPMEIQNYYKLKVGTHTLEKSYKHVNIKLDIDPINML